MRISDCSSDVCSSDLGRHAHEIYVDRLVGDRVILHVARQHAMVLAAELDIHQAREATGLPDVLLQHLRIESDEDRDRESDVCVKSGSGRLELGGRRILKKKITTKREK